MIKQLAAVAAIFGLLYVGLVFGCAFDDACSQIYMEAPQ
jgi:hypothetical protein